MADIKINNVNYEEVPAVDVPNKTGGGNARFYDTSGDDVVAGDIPFGKTAHGASGEIQGSMPVNGDVSDEIETKNGTVTIPAGKTSGGTISIKSSAVEDLTSANLRSGKNVLGISGGLTVPTVAQDSTTKIVTIS